MAGAGASGVDLGVHLLERGARLLVGAGQQWQEASQSIGLPRVVPAARADALQGLDRVVMGAGPVEELRKFESETGVSLSADIAGSFGTDFTVAVERPSLPIPGWVAALEVVRPAVLDATLHRLVDRMNERLPADGHKLTWKQESVNGRVWASLSGVGGVSLFWTYDRGYMILSMDRALAARAIGIRDSGSSLVHSVSFRDRFPSSGGLHQSGFVWINAGATGLDALVTNPALKNILSSREPILIILEGGTEQIHAASRTRLTSMILDAILVASPVVHQ